MKIVVDENVPLMTVRVLREVGHDARTLRNSIQEGIRMGLKHYSTNQPQPKPEQPQKR